MHIKKIITAGVNMEAASKVLILLHGRGSNAYDILSFADYLLVKDFALIAPQATNNTWYPYSFLAPPAHNEPWLSSALNVLHEAVTDVNNKGIASNNICFLGFSQGACLILEYVTRHATTYGGIFAYSGGLIGDKIYTENYTGNFAGTKILLGCSDVDPHIPLQRVQASEEILKSKGADVITRIYPSMGHTINEDEIKLTNAILSGLPVNSTNR